MTILGPKEIPAEAGMLAVRVATPETPQETDMLMHTPNPRWPLYRVTIWENQQAYFGYWNSEVMLAAEGFLDLRKTFPDHWVPLLRAAK